ncbi:MAG: hypothetical protein IKK33_06345 [Lachnospiraceae bacterium]|nr:hypothetical protein [Lachnospiraceae bacterium]
MKYFLLEQDTKCLEVPQLVNWSRKVETKNLVPERYAYIPKVTVLFCKFASNSAGKELIVKPWLLLPEEAADLLSQFEPYMKYKDMPLVDQSKEKMEKYMFPLLKKYDCLSKKTKMNQDKSMIIEGVLDGDKIPDQVLFILDGPSSTNIVVRQDYVECLLKRYIFGFRLRELEVE